MRRKKLGKRKSESRRKQRRRRRTRRRNTMNTTPSRPSEMHEKLNLFKLIEGLANLDSDSSFTLAR